MAPDSLQSPVSSLCLLQISIVDPSCIHSCKNLEIVFKESFVNVVPAVFLYVVEITAGSSHVREVHELIRDAKSGAKILSSQIVSM